MEPVWPGVADVVWWVLEVVESVAAQVFDTGQELEAGSGREVEKQRLAAVVEPEDARVVAGGGIAGGVGDADDDVVVVLVVVRNDVEKQQAGGPVDCEIDSLADCSFRSDWSDKVIVAGKWQLVDSSLEVDAGQRDE